MYSNPLSSQYSFPRIVNWKQLFEAVATVICRPFSATFVMTLVMSVRVDEAKCWDEECSQLWEWLQMSAVGRGKSWSIQRCVQTNGVHCEIASHNTHPADTWRVKNVPVRKLGSVCHHLNGWCKSRISVLEVRYSAMDWVTYGKTQERQKWEQCIILLKLDATTSKDRGD